MNAYLITIGDEILIGQTVNTNAAWLGEQLSLLGAEVVGGTVVRDQAEAIEQALRRAFEEADLVVTTGGLGPTHDDITKKVVADVFDTSLEIDEAVQQRIEAHYAQTDREVPEAVRGLAEIPAGFALLDNPVGTAPGLFHEKDGQVLIVLPGVPQEVKRIMEASGLPRLEKRKGLRSVAHRTLLTTGIVESSLQEKIKDIAADLDSALSLAYLPSTSGVRLRLSGRGENEDEVQEKLKRLEARLRERIDKYVFGTGDDRLEEVVGELLRERGLTVGLAESATGGGAAHRLTDVSGSSVYFLGSVVAYSNMAKIDLLRVDPMTIETQGAVSEAVAEEMAAGARECLGTDWGLSATGIAGPTGGTEEKPVGTVCIGYADADERRSLRLRFTQDRQVNKELFSTALLETLRRQLLGLASTESFAKHLN